MNRRDQGLREVEEYIESELDKEYYDPKQDKEVRRELRKSYRTLLEKTQKKKRELTINDSGEKLQNTLVKTNVLYEDVKNIQEATLDSKLLVLSADINVQKAKSIRIGGAADFDIDEFVSKVTSAGRTNNEEEFINWEIIGKKALHFGKRAPAIDFLLGPLSFEKKQPKKMKMTRLIRNKKDMVTPTQLQEEDIQQRENETSTNVNNIYRILSQTGPINYFKFVTNPQSFSQTVENIFYVSFLARKAVVGIDIENGQPILSIKAQPNVDKVENVVSKKQIVMGIDIKDWKDIIETYEITEPLIPTRHRKETQISSTGWYQ
ncbi:Nse4 C-terminal-domain-containing protein, partial [Pilobolus umbonatus]